MAETKRKPVFTKVDQLRPGTNGHNLVVKVVSSKMVLRKGRPDGPQAHQVRIAECLVGDETGTILFTARNEQVEMMKPETTVILRNAKIDMYKGSMRLAVDKWGRVEVTEPASFTVKEDNNLSLVEFKQQQQQLEIKKLDYEFGGKASRIILLWRRRWAGDCVGDGGYGRMAADLVRFCYILHLPCRRRSHHLPPTTSSPTPTTAAD
ncbi:Nucleic acid-binding- OB-fold-like protein [Striga hermonthica]|uniref:Nucleic acid-binding- OB-fold-like protein n=1 Tax=Striga hermonthica TaxID=68872 RepID=A0A9N7RMT5_STRHE|nr:Nucleic acid-binding- OB-fold-like protein [Striga hermonthica]